MTMDNVRSTMQSVPDKSKWFNKQKKNK